MHRLGLADGESGAVRVSLIVKGLPPNVHYHYRLLVSTTGQTVNGHKATFTPRPRVDLAGPESLLTGLGRTIRVTVRSQSKVLCRGRFSFTLAVPAEVGKRSRRSPASAQTSESRRTVPPRVRRG